MGLDDLQATIEKLKDKIDTHRPYLSNNETATRQVLIDPLLLKLGWDVSDPDQVALEYSAGTGSERADYALKSNDVPVAVIEAKNLGSQLEEREIMQALNYANSRGIAYMAVTNGDDWRMYDVFARQPIEERILMQFSITQTPAHESALQALRMWRSNLASPGNPMPASDPVLESETNKKPHVAIKGNPPTIEPDQESGWTPLTNVSDWNRNSPKKPRSIRFSNGPDVEINRTAVAILRETAKWLVDNGMLSSKNAHVGYPGSPNFYISNSEPRHLDRDFRNPEEIPDSGIYIEKDLTGQDCINGAKALLEHCGEDPDTVQVSFE